MAKYPEDINSAYAKQRQKLGKSKKMLILDTPFSREYIHKQGDDYSEVHFLPKEMKPFHTGIQIYDNKISYFTLRQDNIMAIIIDDPSIYQIHRNMFEFLWNIQPPKKQL